MKRSTTFEGRSCSTSQEMHCNQYYAHDQRKVNEPGGYVKREKAKEPQNNQNQSEYRQHVVFSSLLSVEISPIHRRQTTFSLGPLATGHLWLSDQLFKKRPVMNHCLAQVFRAGLPARLTNRDFVG